MAMLSSKAQISDDDDDDDDDVEWDEEIGANEIPVSPIFAPLIQLPSVVAACEYDEAQFNFNLKSLCTELNLDFYGAIKLINFLRSLVSDSNTENISLQESQGIIATVQSDLTWLKDDAWLKPFVVDDAFLHSIDSFIIDNDDWSDDDNADEDDTQPNKGANQGGEVDSSESKELINLRKQLNDAQAQLSLMGKALLDRSIGDPIDSQYIMATKKPSIKNSASLSEFLDRDWMNVIQEIAPTLQDKVVLEIGSFSGFLSLLACNKVPKRMICVADVFPESVRLCIKQNKLSERVVLSEGSMTSMDALEESDNQVDVIIYQFPHSKKPIFLSSKFRSSLSMVRNRWLKQGGLVLPRQMTLSLSAGSSRLSDKLPELLDMMNSNDANDLSLLRSDLSAQPYVLTDEIEVSSRVLLHQCDMLDTLDSLEGSFEVNTLQCDSTLNCFILTTEMFLGASSKNYEKQVVLPVQPPPTSSATLPMLQKDTLITGSYALYREKCDSPFYVFGLSWVVAEQSYSQSFKLYVDED